MHVITQKRIREAQARWPQASTALATWLHLAKNVKPESFAALKAIFPAIDKVGRFHVFDIGGNKIRLIADVHYNTGRIYIHALLDHADYDRDTWKD